MTYSMLEFSLYIVRFETSIYGSWQWFLLHFRSHARRVKNLLCHIIVKGFGFTCFPVQSCSLGVKSGGLGSNKTQTIYIFASPKNRWWPLESRPKSPHLSFILLPPSLAFIMRTASSRMSGIGGKAGQIHLVLRPELESQGSVSVAAIWYEGYVHA